MSAKAFLGSALCVALIAVPAERAMADKSDVVSGIIGGIIGGVIVNEAHKNKARSQPKGSGKAKVSTKKKAPASTISAAQRAENREVQSALKHFRYAVGTVDGVMGPQSRQAITGFQRTLGHPQTGQLTSYEHSILMAAYHRALAGGPMVQQVIDTHPRGMRGLILMQRDEMAGLGSPAVPGGQMAGVIPGAALGAGAMAAAAAASEPAPTPAPQPAAPALPSFLGQSGMTVSLSSHCNQVGLATTAAGGMVTLAAMADPNRALAEQFCLTRAHALAEGEAQSRNVPGFTPQQIAEQCAAFGPVMQDHVAALSLRPAAAVIEGVEGFVLQSGMDPAQLSATARICLGVGYARDDMGVAVGSALLLTTLGEAAYAELLGHHLSQGFGAARRADLALDWYEMAGTAGAGLMPSMPDRADLIRQAAYAVNGRSLAPAAPGLPVFAAPVPAQPATPAPVTASTEAPAQAMPDPAPAPAVVLQAPAAVKVAAPVDAAPAPTLPPSGASAASNPAATGPVAAVSLVARLPYVIFGH